VFAESLATQGADAQAVDEYREAIRLAPNWAKPRRGLAWVLATSADRGVRNPRDSWGLARQLATATKSQDAQILDTAAAAAAALGRFDDATRLAESAMQLAATAGDSALSQEIRGRLELYRRHEPYVRAPAEAR
jgi:spermidine synthase